MDAGTLVEVEVVVVDIVRTADLLKADERVLRKALEKARAMASKAINAVKVFVVKYELAVAVECCSLGVSAIRREKIATSTSRERFIVVSQVWG